MYPNPQVAEFINQNFIPVKVHIKEQPATFHRFENNWTPTLIFLDSEGKERYRFSGYLPVDYFLAQLGLALGKLAFAYKDWAPAEKWFREVVAKHPKTDTAAEALYWAGVSRYQAEHQPQPLQETASALRQQYPNSSWALRSSVWLQEKAA